eukprot:289709-Alexandrium_andersonii.AAC.1
MARRARLCSVAVVACCSEGAANAGGRGQAVLVEGLEMHIAEALAEGQGHVGQAQRALRTG